MNRVHGAVGQHCCRVGSHAGDARPCPLGLRAQGRLAKGPAKPCGGDRSQLNEEEGRPLQEEGTQIQGGERSGLQNSRGEMASTLRGGHKEASG